MSKIPSRSYCSACKKQSHGKEHCKQGQCGCTFNGVPCRDYTTEQIRKIKTIQRDDPEFTYSKESDVAFDELMKSWRKYNE